MIQRIELKLGNMRRPASFIVYPFTEGQTELTIQSDKRIAKVDLTTGKGLLSSGRGHPGFHALSRFLGAIDITLDNDTLEKLKAIQPRSGDHIGANVFVA